MVPRTALVLITVVLVWLALACGPADDAPPVVDVGWPLEETAFAVRSPLRIEGTVRDGKSGVYAVRCNGSEVPLSDSIFHCDVPLVVGLNEVEIFAVDRAGNKVSHRLRIDFDDVERLVQEFGPVFRFHPLEPFLPDSVSSLLAASYFEWGLIENEFIYELFSQTLLGGIALGHQADPTDLDAAEAIANADSQSSDPDFQSWIRIPDSEKPGDMREAKAYVRLNRWGGSDVLELVFCIFYPYNGPGQFRISIGSEEFFNYLPDDSRGIGKHYSDWEAVILRFSRDEHAPDPYTLEYVGMTAHGKMRVAPAALLESRESHPIVYVALESHAHYPFANPRPFYYERIFEWDLEILTIAGDLFDETAYDPLVSAHLESALDYEVISAEITEFGLDANGGLIVVSAQGAVDVDEPPWLDFEGRWGQFEELRMTFTVLDYPAHTMIDVSAGAKSPKTGAYWTAGWLF